MSGESGGGGRCGVPRHQSENIHQMAAESVSCESMIGKGRGDFSGSPGFRLLDQRTCVLGCLRHDLL